MAAKAPDHISTNVNAAANRQHLLIAWFAMTFRSGLRNAGMLGNSVRQECEANSFLARRNKEPGSSDEGGSDKGFQANAPLACRDRRESQSILRAPLPDTT